MNIRQLVVQSFSFFLFLVYLSACTTSTEIIDPESLSTDLSKTMLYSEIGPENIYFEQCDSLPLSVSKNQRAERISCARLPFGDALVRFGEDCTTAYCETYYFFKEEGIGENNVFTFRKLGKTKGPLVRDDFARSLVSSRCYKHDAWPRYKSFQEIIVKNDGSSLLNNYGWNYIADIDGMQCAPLVLARSLTAQEK